MFGHIGNDATSEACKYLGYKISWGSMKPHTSCKEARAKKEPSPKISERKTSAIPNEIVFLDISTIKKPSSVTTIQASTNQTGDSL